jgi:hypothetical protein
MVLYQSDLSNSDQTVKGAKFTLPYNSLTIHYLSMYLYDTVSLALHLSLSIVRRHTVNGHCWNPALRIYDIPRARHAIINYAAHANMVFMYREREVRGWRGQIYCAWRYGAYGTYDRMSKKGFRCIVITVRPYYYSVQLRLFKFRGSG